MKIYTLFVLAMGIENGHYIILKAEYVVSSELSSMQDCIMLPSEVPNLSTAHSLKKCIDCDISNVIHQLSNSCSRIYSLDLVHDVAKFLEKIATDSGFIVASILDGDFHSQKRGMLFKKIVDTSLLWKE